MERFVTQKNINSQYDWNINTGFQQTVCEAMLTRFREKKNEIIQSRMIDLGLEVDLDVISKKRFSRLACEVRGNEETFYYDDGSDEGLRIVTFIMEEIKPTMDLNKAMVGLNASYY